MNTLIKVAALAAVLSIPAAFAADYPSSPAATPSTPSTEAVDYSKLDMDGNGKMSSTELSAAAKTKEQ